MGNLGSNRLAMKDYLLFYFYSFIFWKILSVNSKTKKSYMALENSFLWM